MDNIIEKEQLKLNKTQGKLLQNVYKNIGNVREEMWQDLTEASCDWYKEKVEYIDRLLDNIVDDLNDIFLPYKRITPRDSSGIPSEILEALKEE